MSISLFDANFYRSANSDLASYSDAQAFAHFQRWGIDEGRQFSPYVNLNFYRSNNSDLASFSNRQLLDHLQTYGVQEERQFSEFVDLSFYRSNNNDLRAFNGEQLLTHLQQWGVNEGRRFSHFVDLSFYRSRNQDLSSFNFQQALTHLEIYGLREGRQFSPAFEVGYYRNLNSDLAAIGFNNLQLLQHFETYGVDEGRISAAGFNSKVYLANNADLKAAGFSHRQAFQHFVVSGYGEGRPGSDYAGNTLATARSSANTLLDFVGTGDNNDFYRVDISSLSTFGVSISGMSAITSLRLLNSGGGEIQSTSSSGASSATILLSLNPGTYYVQVALPSTTQGTNYTLSSSVTPQISGIDLVGTAFDVVQEPLNAGDSFDASFRVKNNFFNNRAANAGAFRVGFYLSTDSTVTTGDRALGFYDVSSLNAGYEVIQIARLGLPGATDGFWSGGNQTYYIGMVVDSLNAVIEGNESNNANTGLGKDFDDVVITVVRPTVTIAATLPNAAEPSTPGQFTITRTGSTATALTVNYGVGGTATSGVDYSGVATSVTIAAGQSTAIIPISVLDDTLVEGNETINFVLLANSAYQLGSSASATVTIADNDSLPTVTLAATDSVAGEPNNPGQFTIIRTGGTTNALIVNYSVGGTATNGSDYSAIATSVTIAPGQSTVLVPINVLDDSLVENSETVVLTLNSNGGYTLGSSTSGTVTIADNDTVYKYDFTYYYNGSNTASDYYIGYVYARVGTYTVGSYFDYTSIINQAGYNGKYYISGSSIAGSIADVGKVYATTYYDVDSSGNSYSPQYAYLPGYASGYNGLGTEGDFVGPSNAYSFGYDNYEADIPRPAPPQVDPGNTLGTAETQSSATFSRNQQVSSADRDDFYRFTVGQSGVFTANLTGLSGDADVRLIQDINNNGQIDQGEVIAWQWERGTANESIRKFLSSGTYFLDVVSYNNQTANYSVSTGFTAAASDDQSFSIQLNFGSGLTGLTSSTINAIQQAARFWESVITHRSDIGPTGVLVIDLIGAPLPDITPGISPLANAGPVYTLGTVKIISGNSTINTRTLAALNSDSTYARDVLIHEFGHVLGVGTLWRVGRDFINSSNNTYNASTYAGWAYGQLLGTFQQTAVPVQQNSFNHWDETAFDQEVLTPSIEVVGTHTPVSQLTIAALRDLGWNVNYGAAEPYVLP